MSYLVFARKWRPRNFDEVIGQEHIATTLKNALTLNRVAHAYLFSGPRGIGKTSTARILAKALNCVQGPTASPCGSCTQCVEISEGRSLDVLEIDGASNRGIEQIRQLRENVKFAPAKGRFKVYIIDEVHQITTDGFNALLKTLEEPPPHVKFIFATTQAHKVIPTILSRCQRFDFRLIPLTLIMEKLRRIIQQEGLDVTEEALLYIARQAQGSMRDAESILDQLSSFCKGRINLEQVTSMLGMIDLESLQEITQKIIEKDTPGAVTLLEKIINEGKDLTLFLANLMEHFRNILITKTISDEQAQNLIDLPRDFVQHIARQGAQLSLEEVFYIFNVLMQAQESLRRALSARVIVEMAMVRLTRREHLASLEEILTKLTSLEQNLQGSDLQGSEPVDVPPVAVAPSGENAPKIDASAEEDSEPASKEPSADASSPPQDLTAAWGQLLQAVRKEKMFVASYLEFGRIGQLTGRVLTVTFAEKHNFYKETLERPENKKIIEARAKEIFGQEVKVKFILVKSPVEDSAPAKQESPDTSLKASAQPIIQSALKIFQGRIVKGSAD